MTTKRVPRYPATPRDANCAHLDVLDLPAGRFCAGCGYHLGAVPPPPSAPRDAEHRCDLNGCASGELCGTGASAPRDSGLREALRNARDALDRDRTGLAAALNGIRREVAGRYWMRPEGGWANYSWEEHTAETLRKEIGWAFDALLKIAGAALSASGTLANAAVPAADAALAAHPEAPPQDEDERAGPGAICWCDTCGEPISPSCGPGHETGWRVPPPGYERDPAAASPQEGRTAPPDLSEEIEEAIREWESSLMSACHDLAGAGAMRQADEDKRTLRAAIGRALAGERARAEILREALRRVEWAEVDEYDDELDRMRTRRLCVACSEYHPDEYDGGGHTLACSTRRALAVAPPETAAAAAPQDEGAEEER